MSFFVLVVLIECYETSKLKKKFFHIKSDTMNYYEGKHVFSG